MTDLERALDELRNNYDRAVKNPTVRSPIAWALYKTWRQEDAWAERERKRKDVEKDA